MPIYPSNVVLLEIIQHNRIHYSKIIKRDYKDFYDLLRNNSTKRFSEILYLHLYPGNYTCKFCGGNNVTFMEITTGYKQYCSRQCLNNSPEHKIGIKKFCSKKENTDARKLKASNTCLENSGYSHHMHNPTIKSRISSKSKETLRKKYFVEFAPGLTQKQYTRKCRHYTNTVYNNYKEIIDPSNIRSREFVLDHIYSIFEGWKNNVPYDIICHPTNLRIIPKDENSRKISRCDKTLTDLYTDSECFSVKQLLGART